jgi:hypothetical protein
VETALQQLDAAWRAANSPFEENDNAGPREGPAFEIRQRHGRIVLSAIHAVSHSRGELGIKENDANTGGLAICLAAHVNATSVVLLRATDAWDANATTAHPIKNALERVVSHRSVLVDLHGMADAHGVDCALGLGPEPQGSAGAADVLATSLISRGFLVDRDGSSTGFTARREQTMTAWAQRRGASAVQLEIALRNRTFTTAPERRERLLAALVDFSRTVDS